MNKYYKETQMNWYDILKTLEEIELCLKEKRDTCLDVKVMENCQEKIEAIENTKAVVFKEIPRKPASVYEFNGKIYGRCPNPYCNHTGLIAKLHSKCYWCGQKLDWEFDIPKTIEQEYSDF